jgi:hypothetical protein
MGSVQAPCETTFNPSLSLGQLKKNRRTSQTVRRPREEWRYLRLLTASAFL